MNIETLKYPIGKFQRPADLSPDRVAEWVNDIEQLPQQLRASIAGFSEEQINTPYRPEGWTVRQLIHHIADSHMNSYIRYRWTLTEDNPTIKAYHQSAWGDLPDCKSEPVEVSLSILEGVHQRWVTLLKSFGPAEWKRTFFHPESEQQFTLDLNTAIYSWHGKHHLAHIEALKNRKGWV